MHSFSAITADDRELLTAYLDGELPPHVVKEVDNRLALDGSFRNEYQEMLAAWSALDALGQATLRDDFAQTTLELAVAEARDEAAKKSAWQKLTWMRRPIVIVLMAGSLGFLLARMKPDPDADIARNLPLLQDFEVYENVPSVDFLRKLQKQQLFADERASSLDAVQGSNR